MLALFISLTEKLGPLGREKNPQVAAFWGFVTGGIGLGIYLLSFIDFVIAFGGSLVIMFFAGTFVGDAFTAGIVGGIFAGIYGYFRTVASNEKRQQLKNLT
jgi:hypothetical protein